MKATCPAWAYKRHRVSGHPVTFPNQSEKGKGKGKGEKGKPQAANFTNQEAEENEEEEENVEQEVNLTTRNANTSGISGSGHWGRKDWPKECSAILDTGFNGGGLCSHAWVQKYVSYLRSFHPKTNFGKYKEGVLRFIFGNRQGRNSDSSTVMPIWADGDFKPVKIRLFDGENRITFRYGYNP